jgi:hypothetical protein
MIDEKQLIKTYEKITKSTLCGRLGDILVFKETVSTYYFITLDQVRDIVRKEGK